MSENRMLPMIAVAIVFTGVGYGISHWSDSFSVAEIHEKMEDMQAKVKQADKNTDNVRLHGDLMDSYHHVALADLAMNEKQDDIARAHLRAAAELISNRSEPKISEIKKQLDILSETPNLSGQKITVDAITQDFESIVPKAMSSMGSTHN